MSEKLFEFRSATDTDRNMILSNWLRSFRDAPLVRDVTNPVYFKTHQELVKRALDLGEAIVAVDPEDHSHAFGWVSFDPRSGVQVVHYLYVKEIYRGLGVGRALFERVKKTPFVFTHRTPAFAKFERDGVYSPYVFLGG